MSVAHRVGERVDLENVCHSWDLRAGPVIATADMSSITLHLSCCAFARSLTQHQLVGASERSVELMVRSFLHAGASFSYRQQNPENIPVSAYAPSQNRISISEFSSVQLFMAFEAAALRPTPGSTRPAHSSIPWDCRYSMSRWRTSWGVISSSSRPRNSPSAERLV